MVPQKLKRRGLNSMKSTKTLFIIALTLTALSAGAWAENPGSGAPAASGAAPAPAPTVVTAADVQALKDAVAAQQLQIQRLTEQLERQQAWQLQQSGAAAAAKTDTAPTQAVPRQLAEANTSPAVQPGAASSLGQNTQDAPPDTPPNPMHGPISIYFKGITITPGGFVEAAFVRRSRELGADITTPFNSLTMPGASQSTLPEFFGSARQSRPTVYVDGRLKDVALSAYISGDFLSAGVTSSATQTNSYTLRLRQAWGQARFDNGWKFLAGQSWSLVTENKAGIAPSDDTGRVNDARPATIDPGYNVGFTFARQYGIRLTKDFNEHISAAISVENPQGTLTTSNNADNFLLGEAGASNSYNTTSNYTANPSPDVVAKVAFDQGFGHYEIFGLADRFTDRVFPCVEPGTNPVCTGTAATGAYNASKEGGGFGFNLRWTLADKRVTFGLHEFGGTGVGRYGAAQLSDISIHANGTLNLIRDYQGLGTLEFHGKKLDVYSYAGIEYAGRAYDFDPNPNAAGTGPVGDVGYGAPGFSNAGCYTEVAPTVNTGFSPSGLGKCSGQTRAIIEGTLGFWYRFYNGPKGRFQFGTQYSYVTRETWSGVAGPGTSGSPSGLDNMVYTSFRYYLP
jgi:Porin subfamily